MSFNINILTWSHSNSFLGHVIYVMSSDFFQVCLVTNLATKSSYWLIQLVKFLCEVEFIKWFFSMEGGYDGKWFLGENPLRCTTKDEKGLVHTIVFFSLIFLFPSKLMNQKVSNIS